jgi:hypothetical protein
MKNVKVRCTNNGYANMELNLPIVGKTKLDENCEVEVTEEVAKVICENKEWELSVAPEKSEEEIEAIEEMKAQIDSMNLEELAEFAQTAKIQGYEKFSKNEKAFKTFLKKRI